MKVLDNKKGNFAISTLGQKPKKSTKKLVDTIIAVHQYTCMQLYLFPPMDCYFSFYHKKILQILYKFLFPIRLLLIRFLPQAKKKK